MTALVRHPHRLAALLAGIPLVLAGCGGGGGTNNGVASLNNSSGQGATTTTLSKAASEKALLSWVQCMRGQGVNISDPTVDANGNLTLRPGAGAGGGNTQTTDGGAAQPFDRTAIEKAQKACGNPPQSAVGGFNGANSQQFQDAALKFAKCMRQHGVNIADPNFTTPATGGGNGGPGAGGGPFGNIDRNDPKTQAALKACQGNLPGGPGGPGGAGGATNG